MKITMVKKVLADGSACKKCGEVMDKIQAAGQLRFIDNIIIADEQDKSSPGMVLAAKYRVNRAPFFLVEQDDGEVEVFSIYFKFVKDVLAPLEAAEDSL